MWTFIGHIVAVTLGIFFGGLLLQWFIRWRENYWEQRELQLVHRLLRPSTPVQEPGPIKTVGADAGPVQKK